MAVPQYGDVTFPFVLGETSSNAVTVYLTQTIGFSNTINLGEISLPVANRLNFSTGQTLTHNFITLSVINTLGLTGTAGYDVEVTLLQYLGLVGPRFIFPLNNHIGFSDAVRQETIVALVDTIGWIDHTGAPTPASDPTAVIVAYAFEDVLAFTEVVAGAFVGDLLDTIGLAESLNTVGSLLERAPSHSVIKQHLTYTITGSRCPDKEYSPFIGQSGDASYGEVSTTAPVLVKDTLQLTHPRVSPTTTLTLKNPSMGNKDIIAFRVIDRQTRGGDRILFADPKWGKTQTLSMEIERVCSPDIDDVVSFINTSLGAEIGLRDWEGRNWKGILIAPNTRIEKQEGGYKVTLQFQGELV